MREREPALVIVSIRDHETKRKNQREFRRGRGGQEPRQVER